MSGTARKREGRFTWANYRHWDDHQRWELISGEAFLMSPNPTWRHQTMLTEMSRQMANHFKGKPCQVRVAPLDVVLSEEDVVQPDLLVVCEPEKIKRTHIEGAPTLVVEILSPQTAARDRREKLSLYARSGVKEYWIVTPWPSLVEVLLLEGGRYVVHKVFGKEDALVSPTFPDLKLTLADVFDFPLEPGEEPPIVAEPPGAAYRAAPKTP
jgi:Uma2 family endonuclease